DFEPEKMQAQEPDAAAARALFTELEFSTLVQDFLSESVELGETDYRDARTAAEVEAMVAQARKPGGLLAIALESSSPQPVAAEEEESPEEESKQLSLAEAPQGSTVPATLRLGISAEAGKALTLTLEDAGIAKPLKDVLTDESLSKTIHDSKSAIHAFAERGVTLTGVQHDPLLYGYLLAPTHSPYRLPA